MSAAEETQTTDAPPEQDAPPADPSLDVERLADDVDELPRRKLQRPSARRKSGFQVVFRRKALADMEEHAQARTDVEVCGMLVGNLYRDAWGPYLLVSAAVPGNAAESRGTSVTINAETWQHFNEQLDSEHKGRKIAGWYHTHPGFGVFLSGMDLFIQNNFFNLPWQVAVVVDPLDGDLGSFIWRGGRSEREDFLVEEETTERKWTLAEAAGEPRRPWLGRRLRRAYLDLYYGTGHLSGPRRVALLLLAFLASFGLTYGLMLLVRWLAERPPVG